jgi:hypothetical protein
MLIHFLQGMCLPILLVLQMATTEALQVIPEGSSRAVAPVYRRDLVAPGRCVTAQSVVSARAIA